MKGVILAGGTGSRLLPLTKVANKHTLPVGEEPMIVHSVQKLVSVGITEILVVTGKEHLGTMISLLGGGIHYGCEFTYKIQEEPDGIGGALKLCENFANKESILVILGDNIFEDSLSDTVENFEKKKKENPEIPVCLLNLKKVNDPERFGVATVKDGKITKIQEKPKNPESDLCVTGVYVYDSNVFKFLKDIKASNRGEYEITDVNNLYIKKGKVVAREFKGWWTDAGTHESLWLANVLFRRGNKS